MYNKNKSVITSKTTKHRCIDSGFITHLISISKFVIIISILPIIGFTQNDQLHTIEGKLQVGNDSIAPTEGTIRYNTLTRDFEGWTGTEWKSFTFNQSDIANAFVDPDASTFSYIGNDIDMSIYHAIAGSLANDKVHVFSVNDGCWGWQHSIVNNDLPGYASTDEFGASVALNVNAGSYQIAAIASPGNDFYGDNAGHVGVYRIRETGSTYEYRIAPNDIAAGDQFGRSMDVNSNFIVISSIYDDDLYTNSGSVYFYRDNITGAALKQKITSPQAVANGNFGYEVHYYGSDLFIYARGEGGWTLNGRVYHYTYIPISGIFTLNQIIDNPEPGNYRYFGNSLSCEGDHLMIGTAQSVTDEYDGTVIFYKRNPDTNNWDYTQKITVPYNSDNDNFGTAIAVDSERMVASAPGYDAKGKDSGALFVFEYDGSDWNQTKMLTVADSHPNANIGTALSTFSFWYNSIMVGSRNFNNQTGAVHFLKVK